MGAPTVAVVNDDPAIIGFLQELLTEEGYAVPVATVAEAHPMIAERMPDAVLLDIRTRAIPVIVCTADARFLREKAERLQALECAILEKPFLIEELLAALSSFVGPPGR